MAIWYNRKDKSLYNTNAKLCNTNEKLCNTNDKLYNTNEKQYIKKKNTNWNYTIRMKKHKQHIKHGMKITVYTWNIDKEMFIQMKFIQNKTKYKFMQYKWKLNKRNEKQCNTN